MKRLFALVAGVSLLAGAGAAIACPGAAEKMAEAAEPGKVSIADLDSWRQSGKVAILDANKAETFAAGHIPGAVHMRHDAVNAAVLPQDKTEKIAAYCYSEQCGASHKLAKALMKMGYQSVFVLPEGIEGWKAAGKPVSQATEPAKTGRADG